jgi:hypothetical protein
MGKEKSPAPTLTTTLTRLTVSTEHQMNEDRHQLIPLLLPLSTRRRGGCWPAGLAPAYDTTLLAL